MLWVKKDDQRVESTPVNENLPIQQDLGGPSSSRSESDLIDPSARQSRREIYESSKSKSMSLKSQLKSPFKFLGKTYCGGCKKKCSGEVLRVNEKYFHTQCFKCVECQTSLSTGLAQHLYFIKISEIVSFILFSLQSSLVHLSNDQNAKYVMILHNFITVRS